MTLLNKNILVGVSGGIAAYKSAELIRFLRRGGAQVRVVMTEAAKAFITPLTLQALSGYPVYEGLLDPRAEAAMGHIELARWTDMLCIAPASADVMARIANGQANDLLTTLCLATKAPIAIVPAMNQQMWQAQQTQNNVERLQDLGMQLWGPAEGEQACGEVGPGRMLEPETISDLVQKFFSGGVLAGKRVLITAGPTREAIDPVRYMSNRSSGKMGYAMAEAAAAQGAQVTMITGPVSLEAPPHVHCISIESAKQMHEQVLALIHECDIFISVAAVADYYFPDIAQQKLAKEDNLQLVLQKNPDILAEVGKLTDKPFAVGFCAQTDHLLDYAQQKFQAKNVDIMIANQVGDGMGFDNEQNQVTVLTRQRTLELPLTDKRRLATQLIKMIAEEYNAKNST